MRETGTFRRALASLLAAYMLLTLPPVSAQAAEPPAGVEITITAFDGLEEAVRYRSVPAGTALEALDLPAALGASGCGPDGGEPGPVTVEGVGWEPDAPWDMNADQGSYTFTPLLPEGYALAEGVEPPELYVRVGEPAEPQAEVHRHPVCGAACPGHGPEGSHTEVRDFIPLSQMGDSGDFCVYLDRDYPAPFPEYEGRVAFDGNTVICLNGHTLNLVDMGVWMDSSVTICDCSEGQTGKLILTPGQNRYKESIGISLYDSETTRYDQYGGAVSVAGDGYLSGLMIQGSGSAGLHGGSLTVTHSGTNLEDSGVFGVFSKTGSVVITGGTLSVGYRQPEGGEGDVYGVKLREAPFVMSGGDIRVTAADSACGLDCQGGPMTVSGGSITATAKSAVTVVAGLTGSITGGTLTAQGLGETGSARAFVLMNIKDTEPFTISGGAFHTTGADAGGITALFGALLLDGSPDVQVQDGVDFEVVPEIPKLGGGLLRLGSRFSGSYTLGLMPGMSMLGGVLAEGVSPEQAAMLSFQATAPENRSWRMVYDEDRGTLAAVPYSALSGTVTDSVGDPLAGAVIVLSQGAEEIARTTSGADGSYRFDDLKSGLYLLTVTANGDTLTGQVVMDGRDLEGMTIPMLPPGVGSEVVFQDGAPPIAVGRITELAEALTDEAGAPVKVRLTVRGGSDPAARAAIRDIVRQNRRSDILFLDLSLEKSVGGQPAQLITDLGDGLLQILVPYDSTGKTDICVYRFHDGRAEALERVTDDPQDGMFLVFPYTEHLVIYASKFSTYAIAYSDETGDPAPPPVPVLPDDDDDDDRPESYDVEVLPAGHGAVRADRDRARGGATVTLTAEPEEGYELSSLTVTGAGGRRADLTAQGGGKYTFRMPGCKVTVEAVFSPLPDRHQDCPSLAFGDLDAGAWYHEAVDYVLAGGIMNGYEDGRFAPNGGLTRAMLVQILYNLEGRPDVSGHSAFTDVAGDAWYADAVIWAVERGIVSGYGGGVFGPGDGITREQLAAMLHRYAGSPAAGKALDGFADRDQAEPWAAEALAWAVERGILTGKGGGVLDPGGAATRAQAAAMLERYLQK